MTRLARVLSVLIASPMDVARHRDALDRGIQLWNRGPLSKHLNVVLEVLRWEHDAVPMLGQGDAQQVINTQLADEADIVVALFHSRLGSPTERHPSGTAEEIAVGMSRGVPVHVYVDRSPLPEDYRPDQFQELQVYLEALQPQGLLASFQGEQELLSLVRHATEHDISELLKKLPAPLPAAAAAGSVRDRLNEAADLVQSAEVYQPGVDFNASGAPAAEALTRRRDQLLELAAPFFSTVIEVARGDDEDAYQLLIELLDVLAANPYQGGTTSLLDQTRFVSALAFHIAGVIACSAGNDRLVGILLAPDPRVTEPSRGDVPMGTCFNAHTATSKGLRDSKQLHDDLKPLLSGMLTEGTFHRAWEMWAYLCSVANVYFHASDLAADSSWPHLKVTGPHSGSGLNTVTASRVRALFDKTGDTHPSLRAGFCGGSHELFTEAATTFESNYGQHADRLDWHALPPGGGVLPSAPHYPGER